MVAFIATSFLVGITSLVGMSGDSNCSPVYPSVTVPGEIVVEVKAL